MISDKGDPLRSPLTPLKKGGIIGKAGIFKCGNHLTGNANLSWIGSPPNNSRLAFQVKGGATIPEPLTILGSATALGFGTFFKRKLSKKQRKS